MNQDNKNQFSLRLVQKCPICNRDYTEGRIEILAENQHSFLAYMSCSICSSSILVRVMTLPHGLIGNAIVTDLAASEVLGYSEAQSVNSNTVLEIHELIGKDSSFIENIRKI